MTGWWSLWNRAASPPDTDRPHLASLDRGWPLFLERLQEAPKFGTTTVVASGGQWMAFRQCLPCSIHVVVRGSRRRCVLRGKPRPRPTVRVGELNK